MARWQARGGEERSEHDDSVAEVPSSLKWKKPIASNEARRNRGASLHKSRQTC